MERARILRLAGLRIVAARHHQDRLVARRRADLMEVDALLQIVRLAHLVPDGAVALDLVHAEAGREIIGDQHIFARDIDARMDRPPFQLDHVAMRRQLAGRPDPERRQIVLVGWKARSGVEPGSAGARRDIEEFFRRMRPRILNAARHLDRAALGKLGAGNIDLVMGQLVSDPRIEGRFLLAALRERETWRHDRTGEHGRHRTTVEHSTPPLDSGLLPLPADILGRDAPIRNRGIERSRVATRRAAAYHIVCRFKDRVRDEPRCREIVHSRRRTKSSRPIGAVALPRIKFHVVRPLGANPDFHGIHRHQPGRRIDRRRRHHLQGRRIDPHRDRGIHAACRIDGQRGRPAYPTGHPGGAIPEDLAGSIAVRAPCAHRSAGCGRATGLRSRHGTDRTAAGRRPRRRPGMVRHADRPADRAPRRIGRRQRPRPSAPWRSSANRATRSPRSGRTASRWRRSPP